MRRRRFVVRVDDGASNIPFKGTNLKQILRTIERKYEGMKRRR